MATTKTADTARRRGIHAPTADFAAYAKRIELGLGQRTQVIVADDIAEWSKAQPDFKLEEMGDLAPPWPDCWIEYEAGIPGRVDRAVTRYAVHVRDLTHIPALTEGERIESGSQLLTGVRGETPDVFLRLVADALSNTREQSPDFVTELDHRGWLVLASLFAESTYRGQSEVIGPLGMIVMMLATDGHMIGNRWLMCIPDGTMVDKKKTDREPQEIMLAAITPCLHTLSLSHLRNITDEEIRPPATPKQLRGRHGALPPVRYRVLRLHLPRRQSESFGGGDGITPGIHVVAGHRSHYGDCCPGHHEPNGKLFGRHTGVYWTPSHMRGDPDRGVIVGDIEVTV